MTIQRTYPYELERYNPDTEEYDYHLLVVACDCIPYVPEQGPTYACGGQPAEGGYVEISSIKDDSGNEFEVSEEESKIIQDYCDEEWGSDEPFYDD